MRYLILAIGTLLAVSVAASSSGFAQTKSAGAKASLQASFNTCVSLARKRGYSSQDLHENREAARNFVIQCMQGTQK
jgi:hypothetical protein